MSILTSILGNVLNSGGQGGGANPILNAVLGMLANGGQSTGAAQAAPQGGLGELIGMFQKAGMGNVMDSWIGTGANAPISGDQISQVLGHGRLGQLAQQMGVDPQQASGHLAELLPAIIDKLTPNGQVPQQGLGNSDAIMGALAGLLKR